MKIHLPYLNTIVILISVMFSTQASAISIGIAAADSEFKPPTAELLAHPLIDSVNYVNARGTTPSLDDLAGFDAVLAYNNVPPGDPVAFGDVLADYVDSGGGLVLSAFAFSSPGLMSGKIMTAGYSPFIVTGQKGDLSGNLIATSPDDLIFTGIDLASLTYFHNSNFAYPGLDLGASILATDGTYNMIARNESANIVGMNLFPGKCCGGNNDEFYRLIGNSLVSVAGTQPVPEPATIFLLSTGFICLAGWERRKRKNKVRIPQQIHGIRF